MRIQKFWECCPDCPRGQDAVIFKKVYNVYKDGEKLKKSFSYRFDLGDDTELLKRVFEQEIAGVITDLACVVLESA